VKKLSKDELRVEGKMTPKGADRAGLIQACSPLLGVVLFGIAAIIGSLALL
jgi:hypothetical protein